MEQTGRRASLVVRPWLVMLLPVCVLVAVLCARWIRIIGYGVFEIDYDFASRLLAGQWQGRDFFSVMPPGTGYSLALFMRILGDHYIVVSVHTWLWWLIDVAVAAGVMRAYSGSASQVAFVAAATALLTVPPDMAGGGAMNHMASALAGLAVILFLWHFRTGKKYLALLAGASGAVCILVKVNVGLAVIASMAAVAFALAVLEHRARRKFVTAGLLVVFGAGAGFALAFALPGFYGGYREVATEIFVGGAEYKGGLSAMALKLIPHIPVSMTNTGFRRYLAESAITIPLLVGFAVMFARVVGGGYGGSALVRDKTSDVRSHLWLICGVTAALSIWSLFPQRFPYLITMVFDKWQLVSLPSLMWELLYLIVVVGLAAAILANIRRRRFVTGGTDAVLLPVWAEVLALMWALGVNASARHNSMFAATLFMPAFALQFGRGCEKIFYKAVTIFLIGWTLAWHVAPDALSTFAHLTPLPSHSKFAGLYWPDGGAIVLGPHQIWASSTTIDALVRNVSPRVDGRSVLWLVLGPGAAFGGTVYRYGFHVLGSGLVPPWAERKFGDGVRARPPDFIVSSTFDDWRDPKWSFMRPDVIEPWLGAHYDLVWELKDNSAPALFLWEKKHAVAGKDTRHGARANP